MGHEPRCWGQHLVLDLAGCPRALITDADNLRAWIGSLVEAIGMRPHGEPVLAHFATHSHDAAGFTLVQLIETSSISAHFAENLGQVYIDVFSCQSFSRDAVIEVCRSFFRPRVVDCRELERGRRSGKLAEAG